MYWTQLGIQTLREDTHPWLMRAGYRHGAEYLPLGQYSLAKIARLLQENDGLQRCGIRFIQAQNHIVAETQTGDDVLVLGQSYAALLNEAASIPVAPARPDPEQDLAPETFSTPGVKTIAQISEFSGMPTTSQMKSLVMHADGKLVMVLLRGDHQLNQHKFTLFANVSEIRQATAEELREAFGADAGSLGPVGVAHVRIVADRALRGRRNMISGANRNGFHLRNVTPGKDFVCEFADLRRVTEADSCLHGGSLRFTNARLLDTPASILETAAEQYHDADGLVLPKAIAPFDVILTPLHPSHLEVAQKLYQELRSAGLDALLDDRDIRPGVKFKDADLLGIPSRVNLGKKLADGLVELVQRSPKSSADVPVEQLVASLRQ